MGKMQYRLNQKNILQILCITCLLFATIAIFITNLSTVTGYEFSIYKSTPIIFWITIFFLMIIGLLIIIYYIFYEKLDQSMLWLIGLFLIFLSYIMCLSLSIIRGYFMWDMNGDPATHIGFINQIILNGNLPNQLVYPILHIYAAQMFLVSNISIIALHKVLPLILSIIYLLYISLFLKVILPEKSQVILAIIASSIFLNKSYLFFVPNSLADLYFPLLLYIFIKNIFESNVIWALLMLITIFVYPIFHPVANLAFFIIICTSFLPNYIFNKVNGNKITTNERDNLLIFKKNLILLLFVWSITWISSFYVWNRLITNIKELIVEGGTSNALSLVHQINYAESYGYNVTEQVLKLLGGSAVYSLIVIISFPILWKNKDNEKLNILFALYGPFATICLLILLLYLTNVFFGPLRMLTYTNIIAIPFVGYLLNDLINRVKINNNIKSKHKFVSTLNLGGLLLLLFIVWINGILTLYASSYILTESYQTTHTEVNGMSWLFKTKSLDQKITGITVVPFRYANLLLTPQEQLQDKIHDFENLDNLKIPYHFGYNNTVLSDYYNRSTYMVIDEEDKLLYKDMLPQMANIRWVQNDFEKLERDISVQKIYSSKQMEIFDITNGMKM